MMKDCKTYHKQNKNELERLLKVLLSHINTIPQARHNLILITYLIRKLSKKLRL